MIGHGGDVIRRIDCGPYTIALTVMEDEDVPPYPYFEIEFDNGGYYCCVMEELEEFIRDLQKLLGSQKKWIAKNAGKE